MTKRVFDSYHVTEEELYGVKNALDQANIGWYETEKGRWWVGSAGIWLKDESDFLKARQAIDSFQKEWEKRVRESAESDQLSKGILWGIRWSRVPVLVLVVGILLFFLSFGFWV